jgi:protein-S-isoprenylcysteine O-methyltransferase Ste14
MAGPEHSGSECPPEPDRTPPDPPQTRVCENPAVELRCALDVPRSGGGLTLFGWLAAVVLFLQLPIPLYWFVVHPNIDFWRRHSRAAAIWTGALVAWPVVALLLIVFHQRLFAPVGPPAWCAIAGLALLVLEAYLFMRVRRDLGSARLVGQTELSGGGELATTGIYGVIRHPRYTASMAAILGACLLAGTVWMWLTAALWAALMLLSISFEEREMRRRFGAAYAGYRRRVPAFLPRVTRRAQ